MNDDNDEATRRRVLTALAGSGTLAALASRGSGQSAPTVLELGGGDMADEAAEHLARVYAGPLSERPGAGVEGRVWVDEDGAVWEDDGAAWSLADRRYASMGGLRYAGPGDDIQALLDRDDRRSVPVVALPGRHGHSSPIGVGQDTLIMGHGGNLADQEGSSYSPLTVFDFTAADVNGFETPTDVDYRSQRPKWRDLAVIGSGAQNGRSGFFLPENPNTTPTKVGLADFQQLYIEEFTYGINGKSNLDSATLYGCHIGGVVYGMYNFDTECKIRDCILYDLRTRTGETPTGIRLKGEHHAVSGTEMFVGDATGYGMEIIGNHCKIHNNSHQSTYGAALVVGGDWNNIDGETFGGSPAQTVVTLNGNENRASDLQFNHSTSNTPDRAVYIGGNNNWVTGSVDMSGYDLETLRLSDADFNHVHLSQYPDGIEVLGTSTDNRIYGRGLDWGRNDIVDDGVRTTLNDIGKTTEDPSVGGEWNGNGYEGLRLIDVDTGDMYLYGYAGWRGPL
jgi:hypothetical protein